ncbi:phospholipase A 2A, partial [Trifolium medium]|nr:phospholipase A 2A [Trifolium medium]
MVALPMPQDTVVIELMPREDDENSVDLVMKVVKRRDPLRAITMAKAVNSGQQTD